jgi:hypothetical protein
MLYDTTLTCLCKQHLQVKRWVNDLVNKYAGASVWCWTFHHADESISIVTLNYEIYF